MKKSTYTIPAGEFKAKCLQLMDEVNTYHTSITITKHGQPVAMLVPLDASPTSAFGGLKGSVTIQGDLLAPVDRDWEANE